MRIEKGHVTGAELNGQMTAFNVNMNNMISQKKDSIGSVLSRREVMVADDQVRLVGVKTVEKSDSLSSGAHFLAKNDKPTTKNDQGWITSVCYSPHFEQHIGLGFLERGHERHGEIIRAWDGVRGTDILVEIVSSHMYDPEGGLQRG